MSVAQLFPRRNEVSRIEVIPDGDLLFRWQKVYSHSRPRTVSDQAFIEPEDAIEAARNIAAIERTDVVVPMWMKDRWDVVQSAWGHAEVAA